MTFELRLLALLILMAVVAGVERWWKGPTASRWREYSFVLVAGCLGGAFGAAFDQLTCTLSPDYFVLGKGLDAGEGFRWRVAQLGFQAGFAAGAVVGCVLLVARGQRTVSYARLLLAGLWTAAFGLALAPVVAVAFAAFDPWGYRAGLAEILPAESVTAFLRVWGAHTGLYAGALLGLATGCWQIRRAR